MYADANAEKHHHLAFRRWQISFKLHLTRTSRSPIMPSFPGAIVMQTPANTNDTSCIDRTNADGWWLVCLYRGCLARGQTKHTKQTKQTSLERRGLTNGFGDMQTIQRSMICLVCLSSELYNRTLAH
jgi:hypothetical protein